MHCLSVTLMWSRSPRACSAPPPLTSSHSPAVILPFRQHQCYIPLLVLHTSRFTTTLRPHSLNPSLLSLLSPSLFSWMPPAVVRRQLAALLQPHPPSRASSSAAAGCALLSAAHRAAAGAVRPLLVGAVAAMATTAVAAAVSDGSRPQQPHPCFEAKAEAEGKEGSGRERAVPSFSSPCSAGQRSGSPTPLLWCPSMSSAVATAGSVCCAALVSGLRLLSDSCGSPAASCQTSWRGWLLPTGVVGLTRVQLRPSTEPA